ncbi:MAG: hypothetical protein HRT89_18670, partial [Lentisphaeria bacterium]|nr:hypothetical protein [Lentisphaeria bacterium]
MRKIGLIICAVVLLYIFISVAFRADINSELKISSKDKQTNLASIKSKLIDPNVPDSWYQETKSASEMGIKNFTQSPLLDARVKSGKLPPVNERLVDPIVIEPYKSIGKYGGTLETYSLDLGRPELRGYMGGFKLTMLRTD